LDHRHVVFVLGKRLSGEAIRRQVVDQIQQLAPPASPPLCPKIEAGPELQVGLDRVVIALDVPDQAPDSPWRISKCAM
jgi:hypothetical protein